jgi:hypothetical protein
MAYAPLSTASATIEFALELKASSAVSTDLGIAYDHRSNTDFIWEVG